MYQTDINKYQKYTEYLGIYRHILLKMLNKIGKQPPLKLKSATLASSQQKHAACWDTSSQLL